MNSKETISRLFVVCFGEHFTKQTSTTRTSFQLKIEEINKITWIKMIYSLTKVCDYSTNNYRLASRLSELFCL